MPQISRRKLLIGGAAAVAVPPVGIAARAATTSHEDTVVRHLKSALPELKIPDTDLKQFAERFLAANRGQEERKLAVAMLVMDNPWLRAFLPAYRRVKYDWFARRLLTDFMFSTDFFTAANRNLTAAAYMDYADAYTLGCRNPLAKFDIEA